MEVSFQWKDPDFLLKNPDFLFRNPDFLLKNVDFTIKQPPAIVDLFWKNVQNISVLQQKTLGYCKLKYKCKLGL